jgi:phosphatidylglycerol:prolipoprotein diacylglycerol transferase
MLDPVCFTVFGHAVRWYGIMLAAGFAAGLWHLTRLASREGREPGFAADLAFWIIIGGILGARVAFVASNWGDYAARPLDIVRVDKGGLVFYGGFFGSGLAIWLFARARKTPLLHLLDYTLTALPLGHALGRIGCFINGCCHGAVHTGWLSCTYPGRSDVWTNQYYNGLIGLDAPHALPVWPVQLFEAGTNLVIYALLFAVYRRRHTDGAIVALYFMLYSTARFFLEFLRGDLSDRVTMHGLTSAQWVSLGLFAAALLLAYILRLRKRYAQLHRPT